MRIKRAIYILGFLLLASTAGAQINIYIGGNLQGNYSWIRSEETSFKPGFGGGLSFVYWEYEYWFIKAGLDYHYKASSSYEYPDVFGVTDYGPNDQINVDVFEHMAGVPLTVYFRPYESGKNALLITGSLETLFTAHMKVSNEEYGELILKGTDVKSRVRTNVGIGVGYQRQLDRNVFLNIYPSFNMDIKAHRPFNTINLTAEILFGVY
jgi:hypothetical protein